MIWYLIINLDISKSIEAKYTTQYVVSEKKNARACIKNMDI